MRLRTYTANKHINKFTKKQEDIEKSLKLPLKGNNSYQMLLFNL